MEHSLGYSTDKRTRSENQDNHGVFRFPRFTAAIVCDGMGGHVGGAYAAALAVRTLHQALSEAGDSPLPQLLEAALQKTNTAIYEAARKNHRLAGMGTTAVVVLVTESEAYVAHVGDSRAYVISRGEARALTRDHTMVNLFVDAELLTPEDAATHPEAHVLSRSLGMERSVDVELGAAVPIERGDTVLLCSDGVHGVVTDWEFANIAWGKPNDAVAQVLRIVEAREGDDNATAVAIYAGPSSENVSQTDIPDPGQGDEGIPRPLSPTPLPEPIRQQPMALGTEAKEPETERQSKVPNPTPHPGEARPEPMPPPRPIRLTPTAQQVQRSAAPSSPPKVKLDKPSASRSLVVGGFALAVALLLCLGVVTTILRRAPTPAGPDEGADSRAQIVVTGAEGLVPAGSQGEQVDAVDAPPPGEIPVALAFSPEIPASPRRLPHRAVEYTQPPPGGAVQWNAVQAARNRNCPKALETVREGMRQSVDYAQLYTQAWNCFNDSHAIPLAASEARTWEDFAFIAHHFEGSPEQRAQVETEAAKELPLWARPAVGGVEYRIEAWAGSNEHDLIIESMSDLIGEPKVADDLARDLLLEAYAAAGLSQVEAPNERVIDWWARRVYVLTRAMQGRAGRIVEQHRSDVVPTLRALLLQATTPKVVDPTAVVAPTDGSAPNDGLPEQVALAQAVALGAPMPDTKAEAAAKVKTTAVARPREPAPSDLPMPVKVHRVRAPVIQSE